MTSYTIHPKAQEEITKVELYVWDIRRSFRASFENKKTIDCTLINSSAWRQNNSSIYTPKKGFLGRSLIHTPRIYLFFSSSRSATYIIYYRFCNWQFLNPGSSFRPHILPCVSQCAPASRAFPNACCHRAKSIMILFQIYPERDKDARWWIARTTRRRDARLEREYHDSFHLMLFSVFHSRISNDYFRSIVAQADGQSWSSITASANVSGVSRETIYIYADPKFVRRFFYRICDSLSARFKKWETCLSSLYIVTHVFSF